VTKGLFETLGGPRIFGELTLILKERNPLPALARMEELGVLRYVHPRARVTRAGLRLFGALRRRLAALGGQGRECCWVLYLAALCEGLGPRGAVELCERLAIPPRTAARLVSLVGDGRRLQKKLEASRPWRASVVHALLAPWPREMAIYVWARTTSRGAAGAVRDYVAEGASAATALKGRDLLVLGYRPGPVYREILAALLAERLEGRVHTREEELTWVRSHYPLS
jgi:tRNA nucleotidyltransferase (CCA-adding enzyme)